MHASRLRALGTFLRATVAGGAATAADLLVLAGLVGWMHVPARDANVPALVVGGIVNFFGNRHFAFRAGAGNLVRQGLGYGVVELVGLALNGVLFDLAVRWLAPAPSGAFLLVRLVTSHLVFVGWSFPLWRLVFRLAPPRSEV